MNKEIRFAYRGERCYAQIVAEVPEGYILLGRTEEYTIYQKKTMFFKPWNFVAVKKED